MDRVIDVLFAIDILVTFRTTFINPKTNLEVVDPTRVAKNYFFSARFCVDLMASIPFELFYAIGETEETDSENTRDT